MSAKQFAVQIPIVGYTVVVIEADTIDEAIALVKSPGFDAAQGDEDGEYLFAQMDWIGKQYQKAFAPDKDTLVLVQRGLGPVSNKP